MSPKSYTLQPDEKAIQVLVGTSDMLIWGDLVLKQQARISAFLTTLAEDFVPLRDVKILYLAPTQQIPPIERPEIFVKYEEILLFYAMNDDTPLPEESETRRFEPIEVLVGSFHIVGSLLKAPVASLQNMLLVSKDAYMFVYGASVRHVAKPWLGTFSADIVQVRQDRLSRLVVEADVLEVDSALDTWHGARTPDLGQLCMHVQEFKDPYSGSQCFLQLRVYC